MTQRTLVVQVPHERRKGLKDKLGQQSFEWRQVPHAEFSVKGDGFVATLYQSGKFVVQGPDPEGFLTRYTDEAPPEPKPGGRPELGPPPSPDEIDVQAKASKVTTVGSDEAGKGDYFGPLVVCATRVEPELAQTLVELGVSDSKRFADARILRLAALIRDRVPHQLVRVDPLQYNERYDPDRGLNVFLAELHAEAIRAVAEPGDRVLVDQFARGGVMKRALNGTDVALEERPRAEEDVAVAAASVLARAEFLLGLMELSEGVGVDLHKGAGHPTDEAGRQLVLDRGERALKKVAKLHFKNTAKILDGLTHG